MMPAAVYNRQAPGRVAHDLYTLKSTMKSNLEDLIDALLTYARVGSSPKSSTPVNCEELFADVMTNLSVIIKEKTHLITPEQVHARL